VSTSSSVSRWATGVQSSVDGALRRLKSLPKVRHGVAVPPPMISGEKEDYHEACARAGFPGHLAPEIKAAPIVDMVVGPVRCVQHSVHAGRVAQYLHKPDLIPRGARGEHGGPIDYPIVVRADGKVYLHDGTHRYSAVCLKGDRTIKVRWVDLDGLKGGGASGDSTADR